MAQNLTPRGPWPEPATANNTPTTEYPDPEDIQTQASPWSRYDVRTVSHHPLHDSALEGRSEYYRGQFSSMSYSSSDNARATDISASVAMNRNVHNAYEQQYSSPYSVQQSSTSKSVRLQGNESQVHYLNVAERTSRHDTETQLNEAITEQRERNREELGHLHHTKQRSYTNFSEAGKEGESSGDEEFSEQNIEYDSFLSDSRNRNRDQVAKTRHDGGDSDTEDLATVIGSAALSGLPVAVRQQLEESAPGTSKQRGGIRRKGPRRAVEPTGDIKLRLGSANEAFQENRIEDAKNIVDEIIRINAETYEAWTLLSSIFQEREQPKDALMALIIAAHLRPKYVEAWFNCAEYALDSMGALTDENLRDAQYCYATAIRHVPSNLEARRRKAHVHALRENYNQAASEYRYVLKLNPHDLAVIRELAVLYIDLKEASTGRDLYRETFEHFRELSSVGNEEVQIDWNDIDSYAVLYAYLDQNELALKELKSLARWLLGREREDYWDEVTDNDCEWDVLDERRSEIPQYVAGSFTASSYGHGLPIELRVNLGKFRLGLGQHDEAMRHFSWLYATDGNRESKIHSHPHLFLEVAKLLAGSRLYKDALLFYKMLKDDAKSMTVTTYIEMGKCFLEEDIIKEAQESFETACRLDETNIEARVELARLFEKLDEAEQAFTYINQVLALESFKKPKIYRKRNKHLPTGLRPKEELSHEKKQQEHKEDAEEEYDEEYDEEVYLARFIQDRYDTLKKETVGMRNGDHRAVDGWMDAARVLTEDFRSCPMFYPRDKKEFEGYSNDEKVQAQTSMGQNLAILAEQYAKDTGADTSGGFEMPNHYRGILFREWLDIFCEYALCLAKRGRNREAYDVCEGAIQAMIFCYSRDDMFLLHVAYCMCALIANDEETCIGIARWFMIQYQFTTDSYRMFGAITRLCHSPISWYNSGPTQKFILRHIKAMDYSLTSKARRERFCKEKASYSHRDEKGELIINQELDTALLMAYGHVLSFGSSYVYAMNYFYRAYALDPDNPMINLALGLAYIQHAIKRQAENRQHGILQGLTFMHNYYDVRKESLHFGERQEAHYNLARTYHLVGLSHLAISYYQKVLDGAEKGQELTQDNMVVDAAYNLQTIYIIAGNLELAESVTKKWLVM